MLNAAECWFDDLIRCAKGEMFGPGSLALLFMLMCDRMFYLSNTGGPHEG